MKLNLLLRAGGKMSRMFTILSLCFLFMEFDLSAKVEYDVTLIAAEDNILRANTTERINFNQAGYVGGGFKIGQDSQVPFIYEPKKGLRVIEFSYANGYVASINDHGMAVGVYNSIAVPSNRNWSSRSCSNSLEAFGHLVPVDGW
jgi:hypothetical protein